MSLAVTRVKIIEIHNSSNDNNDTVYRVEWRNDIENKHRRRREEKINKKQTADPMRLSREKKTIL